MVFKVYQLMTWGNPPSPAFKAVTANGTGVYFIQSDRQKPLNYMMINKNRQYVAYAEQYSADGKPVWKIWHGTEDLGFVNISENEISTYDFNGAGLHVSTSSGSILQGITIFTNNEGATVGRLYFGAEQLKRCWILEVNSPEQAVPCIMLTFIMTKQHRLTT